MRQELFIPKILRPVKICCMDRLNFVANNRNADNGDKSDPDSPEKEKYQVEVR